MAGFDAQFTEAADVSAAVADEPRRRTPGDAAWQQGRWLYHCADACAFGRAELDDRPGRRAPAWAGREIEEYVDGLSTYGSPADSDTD